MEYDMTKVRKSLCAVDDVSPEHCIVEDCEQEKNTKVHIYAWTEFKLELYNNRGERHA